MGTTPRGYPYPDAGDPTDIPGDIQALAEAVDARTTVTETFSVSGTWSKPAGATRVHVMMWQAGGDGQPGVQLQGGAGGPGGAFTEAWLEASDLDATETVTVGTTNGEHSAFGDWLNTRDAPLVPGGASSGQSSPRGGGAGGAWAGMPATTTGGGSGTNKTPGADGTGSNGGAGGNGGEAGQAGQDGGARGGGGGGGGSTLGGSTLGGKGGRGEVVVTTFF